MVWFEGGEEGEEGFVFGGEVGCCWEGGGGGGCEGAGGVERGEGGRFGRGGRIMALVAW